MKLPVKKENFGYNRDRPSLAGAFYLCSPTLRTACPGASDIDYRRK